MTTATYLTNHFLIAMPSMVDPNFAQSVTYICEHTADGALGIIINHPMELGLGEVLRQMDMTWTDEEIVNQAIYFGGPVETQRGFVLHDPVGTWDSTLVVNENLGLTASRDILEAMGQGRGPRRALVALGYAGWGAGQLEQEMAANAWLSGPADLRLIFEVPVAERWQAAAASLGVDLSRLSNDVGHA